MTESQESRCAESDSVVNYKNQGEQAICLGCIQDIKEDDDRWITSTKTAFLRPVNNETRALGRRKAFVRKVLNEHVLQKLAKTEKANNEFLDDSLKASEYIDNYCDREFTPLIYRCDNVVNKFMKYPLYAQNNQTLYKEQIDNGILKSREAISNLNVPFRKNCSFSTSPELAFREPTGGY